MKAYRRVHYRTTLRLTSAHRVGLRLDTASVTRIPAIVALTVRPKEVITPIAIPLYRLSSYLVPSLSLSKMPISRVRCDHLTLASGARRRSTSSMACLSSILAHGATIAMQGRGRAVQGSVA